MKIGRNDPCPCGSGKKYKKCHLELSRVEEAVEHPFKKFNKLFLLKQITALHLTPKNHGKNIRLEQLTREALLFGSQIDGSENIDDLKKIIQDNFDYNPLEDPPVNLFSELITFYGGDYLVLPGISESGVFILSNLNRACS